MAKIKVKSAKEIELIRDAGALAAETLIRAGEMCKPGVSTLEIDEFIGDYTRQHKGISACMGYHGYPRYACISLNEVVCHGIPNANTILKDGDIVNIDITTILSGYHGDTSAMFCVGKVSDIARELVDTAKFCMEEGIRAAGEPGAHWNDIGCAIQDIADEHGFSVVEDYCGHGIGRGFHEEPTVYHFRNYERCPFIDKSGRETPYFINTGEFRTGASLSKLAEFYAAAFMQHFADKAQNLYGPAYKGIPLCAATAMKLSDLYAKNLTFTYNRKEVKDHGEGGSLVGYKYSEKTNVVIIEDVITAGTSVNETMQALSKIENANVIGLLISVDRKEKLENGKSALQTVQDEYGIEAHSIVNINDIIAFLESEENRKAINAPEGILDRVYAYREKWGAV